jgi:hypothetical protein
MRMTDGFDCSFAPQLVRFGRTSSTKPVSQQSTPLNGSLTGWRRKMIWSGLGIMPKSRPGNVKRRRKCLLRSWLISHVGISALGRMNGQ